ncbi:RDD family protein [Streptomyces sp. NEAU-YJ-81]|uniref:RDD family protein n=1 Tax=Streptomyces sp. NEAU-YJ-81 TaxID=2820288 RepID=UPI001ABBEC4E|nr:RDD family protein [Streptomyces sp. NEAU-YJ-81]MBO3679095.1 RDD family protein [Streptomyces sp. NEAU-YJ-81]
MAPDPLSSPPHAFPAGMPPLATPGQRFAARLIDIIVLGVIWTVALIATGALQYTMNHPGEQHMGKVTLALIITMAVYFGYEGVMLARSGQTLGKRALRIRVAMLSDGDVPAGQGWVRAAVYVLPGMLIPLLVGTVFWLVNSASLLWDKPFQRCLHDKAARTVVVSAAH